MLAHVFDIDYQRMKVALVCTGGALNLIDFGVVFPSISQGLLLTVLARLTLPPEVVNVVKALHHDCKCWIKVGGSVFFSFAMKSGVRQGCPLSLLFLLYSPWISS